MTEKELHIQICDYLRLQYPLVRFSSNFGSGMKMTMGQASIQKRQQSHRGYPDLFIIAPSKQYSGLFIEIKKEGEKIFKKDGKTYKSEHLESQAEYIDYLNENGFYATFGIGFDEIRKIIDDYFGNSTEVDDSYPQF